MGIEQSAFEPRSLARAIEIRARPVLWYADRYFRPAQGVHGSPLVEVDVIVGGKRLAPVQRPTEHSRMMDREAVANQLVRLPYFKPARPTSAEEVIQRRAPGSHLYSERDLVAEAQRQIGQDVMDLDDMIERAREYMAAKANVTGITPVVAMDENGVKSIAAEVVWGMPSAHLITLTGGALWSATTSDPLANMDTWARLIVNAASVGASLLTLGVEAASAFLKNEAVLKRLDNRRVEGGSLEIGAVEKTGLRFLGRINGVEIWEDGRIYTDDAGGVDYYTPVDRAVLGGQGENRWHYGPISDLGCANPLVPRWVKTWLREEPSARLVAVHSRCLPGMHQPGATVSAKVV